MSLTSLMIKKKMIPLKKKKIDKKMIKKMIHFAKK